MPPSPTPAASGPDAAPEPSRFRRLPPALGRIGRRWGSDGCSQHAAAIAYYALLSFFPFVLLLASIASAFLGDDATEIQHALEPLRPLLPPLGAVFWDRVQDLVDSRGVLSAASLAVLVWLATRVAASVDRAFRSIFPPERPGPAAQRWLRSLAAPALTLVALLALGLALTGMALLGVVMRSGRAPAWMPELVASTTFTRHGLPLLILLALGYALFAVLPRVPVRRRTRWVGAAFFAIAHGLALTS